jgi:potassium-transporting ATPase KdpC subunit
MWKTISRAFILLISLTILTGLVYPLAVTGLTQLIFPNQVNGSLIRLHGKIVGTALLGQEFKSPQYFHGRPSTAAYDGMASGGSNLAPTNRQLIKTIQERVIKIRLENHLATAQPIPSDLVTASASGLDPHISPEGALLQVPRVAKTRGLPGDKVRQLVLKNTELPLLGIFGTRRVNVLRLNLALDSLKNRS